MTTKTKTYAAAETAFILRQALGPIRVWDDCLADMRRVITTVSGYSLMPVCRIHDGKAWRPYYAWPDIEQFIRVVTIADEKAKARIPVQSKEVEIDRRIDWRVQKIKAMHAPML